MKTLFNKLASNGTLRTLKEQAGSKESLYNKEQINNNAQEMKSIDSKINIDDYIMNDSNLLLTDSIIYKETIKLSAPKSKYQRQKKTSETFKENYQTHANTSTKINKKNTNVNKSVIINSNPQHKCKKKTMSSMETHYNTINSNENMSKKPTFKSKYNNKNNNSTLSNNNRNMDCDSYAKTPHKKDQIFKHKTDSLILKESFMSSSFKKDILNTSIGNKTKCIHTKTDFKRKITLPTTNAKHKSKPKHQATVSAFSNGGDLNLIEEYDYNKILCDIKGIFGENLEFFDENRKKIIVISYINVVLFSSLDEATNKGLIKGLLMLSYFQEKKLSNLTERIKQLKIQHKEEIIDKEKTIEEMSNNFNSITNHLKEGKDLFQLIYSVINETTKFCKKSSHPS